jgi:hypothetical protein
MADGTEKRIVDIKVGDKVVGKTGINTVIELKTTTLNDRKMIHFVDHEFYTTDDHLFLTTNGWKTWNPTRLISKATENSAFLEGINRTESIQDGDILITNDGQIPYADIKTHEYTFGENDTVYDLKLDGDNTYIVGGFVVHNCGGGCFITTAMCDYYNKADNCYELETLRKFRDSYLSTTEELRGLVKEYYEIAPKLVEKINELADKSTIYGNIKNQIDDAITQIENDQNDKAVHTYMNMVNYVKTVTNSTFEKR